MPYNFKILKDIRTKMHQLAKLTKKVGELDNEISEYFVSLGFNEENLRCGNGNSLEELLYGNDITDEFGKHIEKVVNEQK